MSTDSKIIAFQEGYINRLQAENSTQTARITELEAQLAAVQKDAAWQPIETAPKDHFPRLYMVKGRCVQGFIDVAGMHCAQTDYQPWRKMYGTPTHWMPLPKPPIVG